MSLSLIRVMLIRVRLNTYKPKVPQSYKQTHNRNKNKSVSNSFKIVVTWKIVPLVMIRSSSLLL
jgi:hypothetical protein